MSDEVTIRVGDAYATCTEVTWDSTSFGFPVGQIVDIDLGSAGNDVALLTGIQDWMNGSSAKLVSCRLPHQRLRESMALEAIGFRFVEVMLRPYVDPGAVLHDLDPGLVIRPAVKADTAALEAIASTAFDTGRYAIDSRLPAGASGRRYALWVRNAFEHPRQEILVGEVGTRPVGFFVTERLDDARAYWHLTAVDPGHQGMGIGGRLWGAILARQAGEGVTRIDTRISAHNPRVLDLYARLGFRFQAPEMTFHWVSPDVTSDVIRPLPG